MNSLAVILLAVIPPVCSPICRPFPLQNTQTNPTESPKVPFQFFANINTAQTVITQQTNPTEATPKLVANIAIDSTTYWKDLAQNAWSYFEPGNGIYYATGLHYADLDFPYFTDWDLGTYIQAIIDADKLCLTNQVGWDTNSRLNKVLIFLRTVPSRLTDNPTHGIGRDRSKHQA